MLPGGDSPAAFTTSPSLPFDVPRVGGGWQYVIVLPGGAPCLVAGDVMGDDIGTAIAMHQLSSMLRAVAPDQPGPPSEIVRKLDLALQSLDGDTMATLIVATLEQHSATLWRLRLTGAGHPPPLLVSATGGVCYLAHGEDHGTMLGVDPSLHRPDHEYDLAPGSTLLFYTDGLIERPHHTLDEGMSLLARRAGALARPAPGPDVRRTRRSAGTHLPRRRRPPGRAVPAPETG
ncbi:PP2C family protein-serine/threonine phosphatase [Streptomyces sp. NPDC001984]|uniref:PP2C family protein-serine/threonine phosphatase n=1 Tax=Streptomyces sp. NPDC002619 TaxID=3364655 RepID=UPI00369BDA7E